MWHQRARHWKLWHGTCTTRAGSIACIRRLPMQMGYQWLVPKDWQVWGLTLIIHGQATTISALQNCLWFHGCQTSWMITSKPAWNQSASPIHSYIAPMTTRWCKHIWWLPIAAETRMQTKPFCVCVVWGVHEIHFHCFMHNVMAMTYHATTPPQEGYTISPMEQQKPSRLLQAKAAS